jgi:hypothetical protein
MGHTGVNSCTVPTVHEERVAVVVLHGTNQRLASHLLSVEAYVFVRVSVFVHVVGLLSLTLRCQLGYMDHTGVSSTIRVRSTSVFISWGCHSIAIGYVDHTGCYVDPGCHQLVL